MNFYITKPADYWIATNAVSISLNALGHKDRIQGSVASGAVIMCFVADIKPESAGGEPGNGDGLWYDANHEPKRWPLSLSPTSFKTQTRKYVYAAIPRSTSVGNTAVIVFPSQMLDVYGRIKHGEGEEETYEQIGSEDYFYVYLQGIISDSIDRAARVWEQEINNWGTLGTAQGNDEKLVEGEWYRWSTVSQTVTFLKKIIMDAGSQFMNIRLRDKELTGVATAATGAEYVDSETLVVTPSYLQDKFISKKNDDEAEGVIGFLKGIWLGIKDKWFIDDKGDATLHDINASSVQSPSVKTNNVQSSDYTGDGLADTGFRLFSEGGHSKLTVDEIYVRTKLVAEELETKKRTYTGGDQIWSCAGNKVVRVDYLGNTETADHVPVMIPVHADGSPSTAGAADTFMVPQAGDTYGYSYIEVPWLARGLALLAGNKALSKYRKVRIVMQEPAATRSTRAAVSPISHVRRARCYFLANDGENEIQNWWRINDLARCQTMNLANTTRKTYIADEDTKQGNIFWWRKVIGVSYEPVTLEDGKQYHYFDVAFDYDLESSSPETMVTSVMEGSDIPAAGDAVVQFGNTVVEGRMNLMMMEVNGSDAVGYNPSTDAPCLKAYRGVYSFDLTKCWIGGQCCKMKLSPKTGYEFYGPNFKMVTEYDVVPVPMDRGLWNDITPTRDDYREHANVRKCYYYDKVSHNGSYWLCSIVDGSHWVNASGNYISDADYAALSDDAKAQCARKQNYTIDEPSEESSDWTLVVEKGEKGDAGDTPISVFAWNQSPDTAPAISGNAYPPTGWNVTAPSRPSTAGDHYLWMSQSVKHANDTIDNWGTPVRISGDKGDAGEDASDQEFVYIRLTTYPFPNNVTKPADATRGKVHGTGDWIPAADQYETDDWVPEGWSDTALPATENEKYVYAAIRKKSAGHDEDWDDFGEPFLWSNWGVQGIDGDGVQYVYKLFDHELTAAERESNIPTKPQSQTQGEWIPTGWSDDPLAPTVNMQYCYCSTIKKIGGSWADTFDTLGLWSRYSKDGSNGDTPMQAFQWNQSATVAPSPLPSGGTLGSWSATAPNRPSGDGEYFLWMTQTVKHISVNGTVTYDTWSDPVRISGNNGTNGEDGTDYEYIYILKTTQYTFPTNEKPANISTGEVSPGGHAASGSETDKQLDDWVPNGWWDNPQGIDSTNKFEYMSLRVKPKGSDTWGAFSDPFIWSHWGRNGMDGDGTEYVFIRTKNNVPPVMDSTQSGYTADEFRPTITAASQAASDTEQAQTTDDPKGTNDTYKYEWCAKRNMNAPDSTTGQRTWKKFTGENNDYKMSLWSNYAESPLVIDIDNDADQFGTDSLGVVTPAPQVKTTEVSLSYGATSQVLNADDAATPGVAAALFYEDDTAVPSTVAEVSCHRDTTDTTKGEVEVTIKSGTFPSAHSGIYAQITATCARGSKSISFTIQQVKSGAPGVAPDLCNLRPTTNSINFTKSEQQGSTRKTLGCGYTLVTPSGTTNVATAESVVVNGTTYYIYWRYVGGTYAKFTTSAAIYNPGILPTTSESGVEFCLSSATSASDITDANTLDYEKVPILKDGKDGNASITIALTNENEDFLYNEAGTLIAPVGGATSQASLKEGTTDRTTSATWAVSCDGGTTWAEQGAYTSGNAKAKITPSGGLLSVEELYQDSVVIKVRAFYGYKYYYKDFTANKVSQDKYDIHVSPSSIAFNDSESWTSKQITSTASGVDLQGNPIAVTISSDVIPVAGRFYVFYGYVNSDGSVGSLNNTEGTYVTLNRTMARSKMGVYFELRKYITASTYRLCDYETVEIAKTENGADALTFETNPPTPITINQNKTTTTDFGLPKTIAFSGKRGTVALTNVVVTQISNAVGVTAVASSPNDNTCKITAIVPSTVGQQTVYPDEFSFDASISFTDTDGTTKSYTEHISGYINYLGTFRVEVIGDAETAVAASMSQGYGSSKTLTQFGTYIRSSEENISTLEKTVAAKNNMPSSGYTNLSGVVNTTNFNEDEQSFSGNAYTPCLVLLAGTYCLSAYSSGSGLACARRVLAYSGNTKPAKPSSITSETSINMSAVSPAETWDGLTRYKGSFTLSEKSFVFIKVTPPSGGTLAHVQLEKVSESTDNPTPWEEGAKYYTSQIKQTAETIEARANQAGLVIDGVNNHINLIAGKVNFLTAGGSTNPKISIDPQSGALNAVDGNFEGTVRAKNFYHRLSVVEGWTSETYYSQCVSLYITNATQFKSDAQDDGFLSEVSDVKNGDVLVWDAEHYPLGVQYGIFFDGSRPCTGDADEVLYVAAQSFSSYGTLYLPPAASCIGKKVTVHNRHYNNYGLTVYSADTSGEEIVSTGYVDSNHNFVIDSSHPGQGFSVDAGASCSFLAVDGGWLRLDFTPAHT